MKIIFKPFPLEANLKKDIKVAAFILILPMVFIAIVQPQIIMSGFNTDNILGWMIVLGYGFISSLIAFIFGSVIPYNLPTIFEKFNVLKAIIYYLFMFSIIALSIFTFKSFWEGFEDYTIESLLTVLKFTIIIGITPLIVAVLLEHQSRLKSNLKKAHKINTSHSEHKLNESFVVKSDRETLLLNTSNFYYAETSDNYVTFYYQQGDKVNKQLIRMTLKELEVIIHNYKSFKRVHRSFLINLTKIARASGNSRGLTLQLKNISIAIPVSRRFISGVTEYLDKQS